MLRGFGLAVFIAIIGCHAQGANAFCTEGTTIELNDCLRDKLDGLNADLRRYVAVAITQIAEGENSADVLASFQKADAARAAYRTAACDAVYQQWITGSIRGVMAGRCAIHLTELRIFEVWTDWVRYWDSTPPLLPKPLVEGEN